MKFSKKIFAFLCVFSLFAGLVFSQAANSAAASQASTDETTMLIDDSSAIGGAAASSGSATSGASTVWIFFRMIFVLIVVVVCIYLVMSFMRKKIGGSTADDDTFLRKVAQVTIAPGKTVQIVTLLEHAYLIGVTDNSIDLLGEINDKELVDAMNLNADKKQNAARARNFEEILSLFLNPKSSNATEGERKASSSITDFFKSQKEKFNNGK